MDFQLNDEIIFYIINMKIKMIRRMADTKSCSILLVINNFNLDLRGKWHNTKYINILYNIITLYNYLRIFLGSR